MKNLIFILLLITSCAKIPTQSVDLSNALKQEANRMHQMNIALVDYVFNEKKHMINEFIANEYAPAFVQNFIKLLPPDTDVKREMPEIIAAINPKIDDRRDSLLSVLQVQKNAIVKQLNTDYQAFDQAFVALQNMLASAAKLNATRTSIYDDVKNLSGNKINLSAINTLLDNFITGAGSVGEKATILSSSIQLLLNP